MSVGADFVRYSIEEIFFESLYKRSCEVYTGAVFPAEFCTTPVKSRSYRYMLRLQNHFAKKYAAERIFSHLHALTKRFCEKRILPRLDVLFWEVAYL
jgi:hypothetical protein